MRLCQIEIAGHHLPSRTFEQALDRRLVKKMADLGVDGLPFDFTWGQTCGDRHQHGADAHQRVYREHEAWAVGSGDANVLTRSDPELP